MTSLNKIISLILLLSIIVYKLIIGKKYKRQEKNIIDRKLIKGLILLYSLTLVMFVLSLIINIVVDGNNVDKTWEYIVNALSIALLVCPLSLQGMNFIYFKKASKLVFIKTVVTDFIDKSTLDKYTKARLNVIVVGNKKVNVFLPVFDSNEEKEYKKRLNESMIIKTDDIKSIKRLLDKETTVFEFDNLDKLYDEIMIERGEYDNYTKMIKYLVTTYLPIILSYIFLNIMGFPWQYNILLVLLLKVGTILVSRFLYKDLEYDIDLKERQSQVSGVLFGNQEIMFILIQSLINGIFLCLPYMFILALGGTLEFANTLFYIIFIFINLFMTLSYLSEENLLKNIMKIIKNKGIIIYLVVGIMITILMNFNTYFGTRNIELHNYFACMGWGLVAIIFSEFIKLIRFLTKRGKK